MATDSEIMDLAASGQITSAETSNIGTWWILEFFGPIRDVIEPTDSRGHLRVFASSAEAVGYANQVGITEVVQ